MIYCLANIPHEFGMLIAFFLCCATFHITCKCIPLALQILHVSMSAGTTICWGCSNTKSIPSFKYDMWCITCMCSCQGYSFWPAIHYLLDWVWDCLSLMTYFSLGTYHFSCRCFKTVNGEMNLEFSSNLWKKWKQLFQVSSHPIRNNLYGGSPMCVDEYYPSIQQRYIKSFVHTEYLSY